MTVLRISGLLVSLLFVAGCLVQQAKNQPPLLINVLDAALYTDCHIPGSVRVDFDKVEDYVRAMPKDRSIIVYCSNHACMTSHFVVKRLLKNGYYNAQVYAGGMAAWLQAGYPVEGPAQEAYLHKEQPFDEQATDELPTINTKRTGGASKNSIK